MLLGDGAGSFAAPLNFAVGDAPVSVAVGDFTGDGDLDLATANAFADEVSVLIGDGAGSFAAPSNFAAGGGPQSVAVGDFDGDGDLDLAVADFFVDGVSVLAGDGLGGFAAPATFAVGDAPVSVAVGDLDGDGDGDLAVANLFSANVSVLLSNRAPTATDDAYVTSEDTALTVAAPGVLGNDTDPDGDALTSTLVSGTTHGTLTLSADGSFSYTPAAGYNGPDTFTYRTSDGAVDTNPASVSLTVTAGNDPPTATVEGPSTATVGMPVTLKVGAVDTSPTDMAGTFTYTVDWGDGTPVVNVSGPSDPPVTHTYASPGTVTVTVTATDPRGATSAPTTFTLTVTAQATTTTPPVTSTTPPNGTTLPATGSDVGPTLLIALALSLGGGVIALTTRRRPRA